VQNTLFYQHDLNNRKTRRHIVVLLVLLVLLVLFFLASCAPVQTGKKNQAHGKKKNKAASTRAVGHDIEASLRGKVKNSALTLLVNQEMDRYDREQLNHVFERGLSGQTSSWTNPDKGNQYRLSPLPAFQTIGKSVCRKAKIEALINGNDQFETINSKACRANNGQWRISQEK
jgi:surface antigen